MRRPEIGRGRSVSRGRPIDRAGLRQILGHEIRRSRIAAGLTLAEVGSWIDRGPSSIHAYETGGAEIAAIDLIVLAARLGIDAADLVRMIGIAARVGEGVANGNGTR